MSAEGEGRDAEARPTTSGPAAPPVLEVHGLDVSYGRVQVLFDVDLELRRGQVLAVLGANGAGKSTLLRTISGLLRPDQGTIRLDGRDITRVAAEDRTRRGIVLVVGGDGIFDDLTVDENLRVGTWNLRNAPDMAEERIEQALDRFPDLRTARRLPAGALSGGQQQMLTLAKGLLLEAELLMVDELSLGLAPRVVRQLLEVVDELVAAGTTMIVVEQSLRVALRLADRAVFLEKGRVRFEGGAEELRARDDLARAVFLGADGS